MKWIQATRLAAAVTLALALAGCAATTFDSTWTAPGLKKIDGKGKKIAAFVISSNEGARRVAEDALAQKITAHGSIGIAGYTLVPTDALLDTTRAKALLIEAGVQGVVLIRVTGKENYMTVTPGYYGGGYYGSWGGYYGGGYGAAYSPGYVESNTVVSAETLLYSLTENRLLWAGLTKTDNPSTLSDYVTEIADAVAGELQAQGLIGGK